MRDYKQCKLCSSDYLTEITSETKHYCQGCEKVWKEKLAKCQEWEINKKRIINDFLNDDSKELKKEMWELKYMGGVIYNPNEICQKCNKMLVEKNNCGDIKKLNHNCPKKPQPTPRERERERERANSTIFQI